VEISSGTTGVTIFLVVVSETALLPVVGIEGNDILSSPGFDADAVITASASLFNSTSTRVSTPASVSNLVAVTVLKLPLLKINGAFIDPCDACDISKTNLKGAVVL